MILYCNDLLHFLILDADVIAVALALHQLWFWKEGVRDIFLGVLPLQ